MKHAKKLFVFILAALTLCTGLSAQAADNYMELDGLAFTLQNGEAVIRAYNGESDKVIIPETLLGEPVTAIGSAAFFEKDIAAVYFDSAVQLRSIGNSAFSSCTGLKSVELPDSVTQIEFGAFQDCAALETLSLGSGVTAIGAQSFCSCESLTTVELPESTRSIGKYAFGDCGSLRRVLIPSGVSDISASAFDDCEKLTVYCYTGSAAHAFAQAQSLRYVLLDAMLSGDADANGKVNVNDVTTIQRHLADVEPIWWPAVSCTDLDGDGSVTISDATILQRRLAEFI